MTMNRHNIDNYVIIINLKSKPLCKLINKIPGLRLLISSLPGWALKMHVGLLSKLHDSTSIFKAFPGNFDIKRKSPSIIYLLSWLIYF